MSMLLSVFVWSIKLLDCFTWFFSVIFLILWAKLCQKNVKFLITSMDWRCTLIKWSMINNSIIVKESIIEYPVKNMNTLPEKVITVYSWCWFKPPQNPYIYKVICELNRIPRLLKSSFNPCFV